MRFILDTDHVSLLLRGDNRLQRLVDQAGNDVGTTVITVQELFIWLGRADKQCAIDG